MTIDDAYELVQFIANVEQKGEIKPDEFNRLAPQAQLEFYVNRFGNPQDYTRNKEGIVIPVPLIAYPMTQEIKDSMLPFTVNSTLSIAVDGKADLPNDYLHVESLNLSDGTEIDIMDRHRAQKRRKSKVVMPEATYPIAYLFADAGDNYKKKLQVYPTDTGSAVLSYMKVPVDPNWDYTYVNEEPVYNSTQTPGETGVVSQDFQFPVDCHMDILMNILQYCGVHLSLDRLTQFSLLKQQSGA